MRFKRQKYTPETGGQESDFPIDLVRPGTWVIEAACTPPREHRPGLLLGHVARLEVMALSLRTDTILQLDIAAAITEALDTAGCRLSPLAKLALHEVVVNAAMHGNLAIDTGPATTWTDLETRQGLVATALKHEDRQKRVVTVALGWDAACVTAVVADQGLGYCMAEQDQHQTNHHRGAGRGLILARMAARIDVLQGGRSTRLTFDRPKAEAS